MTRTHEKRKTQMNAALTALCFLMTVLLSGCLFESSRETGGSDDGAKIYYKGHVQGGSGLAKAASGSGSKGVANTPVSVAEIQADGSLEIISEEGVTTDAKGFFTVSTSVEVDPEKIVILAGEGVEAGIGELRAVVSSAAQMGDTVLVQTLNTESTLEADVFLQLLGNGRTDFSYADVAIGVSGELAGLVSSQTDLVDSVVAKIGAAVNASHEFLLNQDVTADQMDVFTREKIMFQADFEAALLLNLDNPVRIAESEKLRMDNVITASATAEIPAGTFSQSLQTAFRAQVETSAQTAGSLAFLLATETAKMQAMATRIATETNFQLAGAASASVNIVAQAGDTLSARIAAAADMKQIETAFAGYHQEVYTELLAAFNTEAGGMALIAETSDLRATLDADLAAASTEADIITAYSDFYAGVEARLSAELSGTETGKVEVLSQLVGMVSQTEVTSTIDVGILAHVSGSVESAAEGLTVELLQRQSDGELTVISDASVTTDANGGFVVGTNFAGSQNVIVRATGSGEVEWKAVISSITRKGDTVLCRPLNVQSTAEADVWLEAKAGGSLHTETADISLALNAEAALAVSQETALSGEAAAAIEAYAETRNAILTQVEGRTQAEIDAVAEANLAAQIQFESALHAAGSDTAKITAARDTLVTAILNHYAEAGIAVQSSAKAAEAGFQAALTATVETASQTRAYLVKNLALFTAQLVARGHETSFTTGAAAEAHLLAVAEAADTLQARLQAAASVEVMTEVFLNYNQSVYDALLSAFDSQATTLAAIAEGTTLRMTLQSKLSAATTAEAVIEAYSEFYAGIQTRVEADLESSGTALVEAFSGVLSGVGQVAVVSNIDIGVEAVVSGSVPDLAGSAVALFEIQSNGELVAVGSEVTADASGQFTLAVSEISSRKTLVRAVKDDITYMAVISGALSKGDTIPAQTLTVESTQEALVWLHLLENGEEDISTYADVAMHISAKTAAEIQKDSALIVQVAADMEAALQAEHQTLIESGSATETQLNQVAQLRAGAQAEWEASVNAAGGDDNRISSANQARLQAWIQASATAGITSAQLAQAAAVRFAAQVHASGSDGALQLERLRTEAMVRAEYLQQAVEEQVTLQGGAYSSAMAEAGVSLKSDIVAAASVEAMGKAMDDYHQSVYSALLVAFESRAAVLAQVLELTSARQVLELSLVTGLTADSVAGTYVQFYGALETEASAALATDSVQLESLIPLIVLLGETEVSSLIEIGDKTFLQGSLGESIQAVALGKITAQGDLEHLANGVITDSASGDFILTGTFEGGDSLVAVVYTGSDTLMAVLEDSAGAGDTISLAYLSGETTAEALVWMEIMASQADSLVGLGDVQYYLDAEAAAEFVANGEVQPFAAAVAAMVEAQVLFLVDSPLNIGDAERQSILSARAAARKDFDAAVKAAEGIPAAIDAATAAHLQSIVQAFTDAQVSLNQCVKSLEIEARTLLQFSDSLSAQVASALAVKAYHAQSYALDAAVTAEFTAASASAATLSLLDSAGDVLVNAVAAAADTTVASVTAQIHAALDVYSQAVVNQLATTLTLQAAAITTLDSSIRTGDAGSGASAGTRAGLNADMEAAADAAAIIAAMLAFESAVESQTEGALTGASQSEINFSGSVLVMSHFSI